MAGGGEKIKWGIIGPGNIAQKFALDLELSTTSEIAAVGSRSLERAVAFGEQFDVPNQYGSYEEVARDPAVDIVYVATPHTMHYEHTLLCLQAGKHVLCEKPFAINARESAHLIEIARQRGLFLMEAMWVRYLPAMTKVREWLKADLIGEARIVKADYGICIDWDPKHRLFDPELGGGALLDLGVYPISFASMVYGEQPEQIFSTARIGETGVDEQFSLLFSYPGGKSAVINSGTRLKTPHEAYILGTKGSIRIPVFPSGRRAELVVNDKIVDVFEDSSEGRGSRYEAEEAVRCLRSGRTESAVMPLDETLGVMRTMDRIRREWGVTYRADR
ncbi:Gfo/Idh/MocA family oxidoreductase [Paenibacillus sp.]|uniref:Gfo/Idh/MocA family protein n=1 Tax=Paenibacillus sp. TaxID=58172 RepID=UPI002D5BF090|nr:Gfo/Idh/MocA family oxidoreductase [Paenibacillus sp.]HZG57932.1 Gfo/Idh/MocA family oxidoreductase [Paenibacillus sp.]